MNSVYTHNTTQTTQQRLDNLQQNANQLFSLGFLRKQLWEVYQQAVADTPADEYGNYNLLSDKELRFAWKFVNSYKTTLDDIRCKLDNSFDGHNPLQELKNDRDIYIQEFVAIGFSNFWECIKKNSDNWRSFARRIPFDDPKYQQKVEEFFSLLDQISIITDILCGKADMYGLHVDDSLIEQLDNDDDDSLINSKVLALLDKCVKNAINNKRGAKDLLLPIRAARDAEVLPCVDLAWVNKRYKLTLSPQNWSEWINKDLKYDPNDYNPLFSLFEKLKNGEKVKSGLQSP